MQSKIKKYATIAVVAVLVAVVALYFLMPKHITVDEGEDIYISYVEPTLEVVDMNSVADMETSQYKFSAGDEGYNELVEMLESITYHNCIKTLLNSTSLSDIGYVIYIWVGDKCYGFYDWGYVVTDKIYYASKNSVENIRDVIKDNMYRRM